MASNTGPIYLPKQKVRRGKAGYKGKNIKIVDDPAAAEAADREKAAKSEESKSKK